MVHRAYWKNRIEEAWSRRSVVWLSGVRRAGKTYLCQSLPDIEYFDCELPRVRALLNDPEGFLSGLQGKRVVLDEVHRMDNPSELLKIAADHYPSTRVLATGSSTLGASRKFRDTLTGRKEEVRLTPMIAEDLKDFGSTDLGRRVLHGGLPPFFLADDLVEQDYQEWLDAFWARDIQELFRLERRNSFVRCAEMLLSQSGSLFEATRFTAPCEVSRPTIANYLAIMEVCSVIHIVRPFSTHKPTEIVAAPKVYGFDTGFVCYEKGWREIRPDDYGLLWEHLVLNEMVAHLGSYRQIKFWRDKRGHEIDFVLERRGAGPTTVECKWSAAGFDPVNLLSFRRHYSDGDNFVVAHDVGRSYTRIYGDASVTFIGLEDVAAIGR